MIQALVFDLDGTLVDTRHHVDMLRDAYSAAFPHRPPRPYSDYIKCYSMTVPELFRFLELDPGQARRYWELYLSLEPEGGARLFPGAAAVLKEAKGRGLLLGINTSRAREDLEVTRRELGEAYQLFDYIVTATDVENPKPAADPLRLFCRLSALRPEEVLYIGDGRVDSACAQAAGCPFAAAGWGTFLTPGELPAQYWPVRVEQVLDIARGS